MPEERSPKFCASCGRALVWRKGWFTWTEYDTETGEKNRYYEQRFGCSRFGHVSTSYGQKIYLNEDNTIKKIVDFTYAYM